jgi:ribosomal protein S6--L-glutamate ligase
MRLAVLSSPESWYLKDLRRAASGRHEVLQVSFRQLQGRTGSEEVVLQSGGIDLGESDAVFVRSMPPGTLEQVVFRMDALAQLAAEGVPVVNPPKALEAAIDKYLTTSRLRAAGLEVPRTFACQTASDAMGAFEALGGQAVIKPLFGGEGRGITKLSDPALAERAFRMLEQFGAVIYLQEFVLHAGYDLRLLVLGDRVLGMRRRNERDWRTNVSRGATTEPLVVDDELTELARRSAAAVGAALAGVDLLPARDGRLLALEVNAVPGWRALASTLEVDVAAMVLEFLTQLPHPETATREPGHTTACITNR